MPVTPHIVQMEASQSMTLNVSYGRERVVITATDVRGTLFVSVLGCVPPRDNTPPRRRAFWTFDLGSDQDLCKTFRASDWPRFAQVIIWMLEAVSMGQDHPQRRVMDIGQQPTTTGFGIWFGGDAVLGIDPSWCLLPSGEPEVYAGIDAAFGAWRSWHVGHLDHHYEVRVYPTGERLPEMPELECICAEINSRHCPIHSEPEPWIKPDFSDGVA